MHLNRYQSKQYNDKKISRLYKEATHYPNPVYNKDDRLVRIWKGNHKNNRYKFYKRYANKHVRLTSAAFTGGQYKKVYDYWWNVD